MTITVASGVEVGAEAEVAGSSAADAGSGDLTPSTAAERQPSTAPALLGLATMLVVEAVWAGLLLFVVLRLIVA